jgi:hypothetical protein
MLSGEKGGNLRTIADFRFKCSTQNRNLELMHEILQLIELERQLHQNQWWSRHSGRREPDKQKRKGAT